MAVPVKAHTVGDADAVLDVVFDRRDAHPRLVRAQDPATGAMVSEGAFTTTRIRINASEIRRVGDGA